MHLSASTLHSVMLTPQPCLRMSIVDVAAGAAGTIAAGYLTGAAAGPALSSAAALKKGLDLGSREWSELRFPIGVSAAAWTLTIILASTTFSLGSSTLSLVDSLLMRVPLFIAIVAFITAFVPMVALLSGTFLSPAIPFKSKEDAEEYTEMQDSYRSDQWQAPRMWSGRGEKAREERSRGD